MLLFSDSVSLQGKSVIALVLLTFAFEGFWQLETESEDLYFSFSIYSSKTGSWRTLKEICHCNEKLLKNKGIFIGRILHWFTDGNEILTFNAENELRWLISFPVPTAELESSSQSCMWESDGQLYYAMVSENGLNIWFLEDYFEFKWNLKYSKDFGADGRTSRILRNLRESHTTSGS